MLLVVTPNPALDRTMVFENLRLGAVLRTNHVLVAAGGKGLNVARATHSLGQAVHVCGPLGGLTGQLVAQHAAAEGIAATWHWYNGETRTCVLLIDPAARDATALNEAGPDLDEPTWQGFVQTVATTAMQVNAGLVAISGSLPPGPPPQAMGELIRLLHKGGQRVLVDSSGPALTAAIAARPFAIKVNGAELGAALHMAVETEQQAMAALGLLRKQGVAIAMVSLGARGAIGCDESGCYHALPPAVKIVSTIGSGDSLLAGLATGLLRGEGLAEALRLGVACGTADALTIGGGLLDMATVELVGDL
ncbi:MAG: 1-phosphofructokinase family hexose kinase, partial [Chloroflexaceae bacterium]|nr:1-phosphofructokinase family hexose kinase [Chloroflexaceae bacterium]